jgi:predicted  nucleic acid-binding Zn-ribbon protein
MLVVLARMEEMDGLRGEIKELKDRQDILATALQIALEELEKLQKEHSQEKPLL